jgi:hypothetical protein
MRGKAHTRGKVQPTKTEVCFRPFTIHVTTGQSDSHQNWQVFLSRNLGYDIKDGKETRRIDSTYTELVYVSFGVIIIK